MVEQYDSEERSKLTKKQLTYVREHKQQLKESLPEDDAAESLRGQNDKLYTTSKYLPLRIEQVSIGRMNGDVIRPVTAFLADIENHPRVASRKASRRVYTRAGKHRPKFGRIVSTGKPTEDVDVFVELNEDEKIIYKRK